MATEVRRAAGESQYEIVEDGRVVGIAEYVDRGDVLVFHHTEVDAPLRGGGLGARLVRAALDDVRAHGRTILPTCSYVARFIDEHPDYADLLVADEG